MKTNNRDASMDLMRITAMLLVMLFHINFYNIALEEGGISDYSKIQIFGYSFMKCISMVCVNMFILISGWYGINPSLKGICKLAFQICFFSVPTYLIFCFIYDDLSFSPKILCHLLLFGGYWFIPAYFILYICSPILNAFVSHSSRKSFLFVLIAYYLLQFFYGWIEQETYFDHGCSPLAFFGLYLTARYIRLYTPKLTKVKSSVLFVCYVFILLTVSMLCCIITMYYSQECAEMLMQYVSPFNTALSILLLLLFSRLKIRNRYINIFGISCFSAYLLHGSPFFYEKIYYPLGIKLFYSESAFLSVLFLITMIVSVFLVSIMIDKIRIIIWNYIETATKNWV